ncbi:HlyD family efflux transporter periplasmic adaptor subunit [Novosphingobium mangrovi (ex Huang et al. 2023)]|uniref:HlyD family efflux transporter periplasmic adaptor subunit n=1 Tax=Novosphingobium mangrovi (ex Huang et al. 2023) TaxID=2976432 RepID=A0ABT2I5F0_9SPHN|nr:HlyD family efflux transporter periplasmic adaptor subunit [Novosphingobium mangrovi (ex Huang et al. 2023)]MCT2399823.1 HlyD family efflux transporter periplasmic adaptor subunit [Novosphingobium mangrovi (ex Huang et al. 2023)]
MSEDVQDQPADGQTEQPDDSVSVVHKARRGPMLVTVAVVVAAIVVLYFLYDVFIGSRSVSTDNAYVAGEVAEVTPLTSGRVVEVMVTDTQPVRRGQILFRIDDSDQRIVLAQAKASMEYARRRYGQSLANDTALGAAADASETQIGAAQAKVASAEATLAKARTDYERRAALADSGAVSGEELTAAREALASAKAAANEAQAGLASARSNAISARRQEEAALALTRGTSVDTAPEVLLAKSRLATAELDLKRTIVRAPIDGVVAKRTIQVGQKVENGKPALAIVPVSQLYVDANFKEDQLGKVRSGQKAELTSDFYGDDVVFHGKVVGFAGGTGAAFSLIPAQNATGNWIKVVQRLPVRIELDPEELKAHPLRIGLSMEAKIDLTSKD